MNPAIEHNFKYHPPVGNAAEKHTAVRAKARELALLIDESLPVVDLAIENIEYCLRRDRINQRKPG